MKNKLIGTGTAIITPFRKEGNIDFKSFKGLIEYQINNGINYLVFMGTTGEAVTLNEDERNAVIHMAVENVDGRVPVVIGMGGNNTQAVVNTIKKTDFEGVDAILSVSPCYNKPQQRGIFNHYKNISAISPVPVIVYNVPSRTGSNITAETTLRLAHEIPNIIAVKEASGDLVQCAKIIRDKPDDFLVISGDDVTALPFMALGGDGVISVISNALPAEFSSMINFCLKKDFEKARKISLDLIDIIESIYAEGNPSGVKSLLELKDLCQNVVRLPLVKASKALQNQMAQQLEKL